MKTIITILLVFFCRINLSSQTVNIGSQIWMRENLNLDKFRNGDLIPHAETTEQWNRAAREKQPAWCYYGNDQANGKKYGKLYNWYAVVDPRGLAPVGWHIPTDFEWTILEDYLDGNEGEKLKETLLYDIKISYRDVGGYYEKKWVQCDNCSYWTDNQKKNNPCSKCKNERGWHEKTGKYIPVTKEKVENKIPTGWDGTNLSGFSGLPGGHRSGGIFSGGKDGSSFIFGEWWSSSDLSPSDSAFSRQLCQGMETCNRNFVHKGLGLSVRCVKD